MFFIRTCLPIMLILSTFQASANSLKCSNIFTSDHRNGLAVLELIRPDINEDLHTSNWLRKIFFQRALKFVSENYLQANPNANSEQLSLEILKNLWLADFFQFRSLDGKNNITSPFSGVPVKFVERNVLQYGIKKLIHETAIPRFNTPNFWANLNKKIETLAQNKALLFIANPLSLIKNKDNIRLPSSLIAKIIIDGIPSHFSEIEHHYQKQIPINKWNSAIAAFKSVIYLISAIITYEMYEDFQNILAESEKEKLFKNLDDMEKKLDTLDEYFENAGFYNSEIQEK